MSSDTSWRVGRWNWRIHSHKTQVAERIGAWKGCFLVAWYYHKGLLEAVDVAIPQRRYARACHALGLPVDPTYAQEQSRGRKLAARFTREELRNRLKTGGQIDLWDAHVGLAGENASTGLAGK